MNDKPDNDTTPDGESPAERLAALLALAAEAGPPPGPTPDLREIQAWHLGRLEAARAAEVKSHVARDPQCYRLWRELIADDAEQAQAAGQAVAPAPGRLARLWQWLAPRPGVWLGGGLAAALALVLAWVVVPLLTTPPADDSGPVIADSGSIDWSATLGSLLGLSDGPPVETDLPPLETPVADVALDWPYLQRLTRRDAGWPYAEKIAFQTGLRAGLSAATARAHGWAAAIEALPEASVPCTAEWDAATCTRRLGQLREAGRRAAVHYVACLDEQDGGDTVFDAAFWRSQQRQWREFGGRLLQDAIDPLGVDIADLARTRDRSRQCRQVRALIGKAF